MSDEPINARSMVGAFVRGALQAIVRTGTHAAIGSAPPRYCGPCAQERLSGITLWQYEQPGKCAKCGEPLAPGEGLGCADLTPPAVPL